MSLGACIPGLEAEGKITADQAATARALYEERLAAHLRSGSRETAEALASKDVLDALEHNVTRKEFLAGLTIKRRGEIEADLRKYGAATSDPRFRPVEGAGQGGLIDPRALPALMDNDPRAGYSNVEGRRKAILGDAQRQMDAILTRFSANLRGQVRNKAELGNMVRELFEGGTGDRAATEMADAWRRTAETLRQRFNQAGGDIGFRSDWGLPQTHNWKAVRKAGYDAWRDFIKPRLDVGRMVDQRTGLPMTEQGLELALREVFENIRSNSAAKITPGSAGKVSLANSRGEGWFLVFRDAESWTVYADEFGSGTAYDAMMGHIDSMAREIAAMEILGPNPDATLRWIADTVDKQAKLDTSPDTKSIARAERGAKKMNALWDEYRGANRPNMDDPVALVFSNYRALATARLLGSATLSAVSDFNFQASRRAFNGLSNKAMVPQYLELMKPGSLEQQKLAIRRGLIAEEYAQRTAATSRYMMEELTGETSRRIASGVMRISLLSRHTQTARWAYGMETLSTYTEQAGKQFGELEAPLRGALERYGIDAAGWDKLRAAPMDTDRGVDWISPHNLSGEDRAIGDRFMEMIHTEVDMAVPVADLRVRAMMAKAAPADNLFGQIMRSGPLMFRSFGLSVAARQIGQIMAMQPATAIGYAVPLIIGTTLFGGISLQLKALATGKDPRPMKDEEFWLAALEQGGGFGIFGDLLFGLESRTGNGAAMTAAGVLPQDIDKIGRMVANPQTQGVKTVKGFIPGNNLWYTRLATDRLIADTIEDYINPDVRAARKRMGRFAAEQGTAFWWAPGDDAPRRAPDFANALEEGSSQ